MVMKKTRKKLLQSSIAKSGVAFLATGSIAAVGVALFTGCRCAAASLAAHVFSEQPALSIPAIASGFTGIGWGMLALMLLIGAGTSYAAIARMVEQQRPLIAMQRAMGFTGGEVTAHYMTYGLLSAVLGAALGLVGGLFVAILLLDMLAAIFLETIIALHYAWESAAISCVLSVAVYGAAAYGACAGGLRRDVSALLRQASLR